MSAKEREAWEVVMRSREAREYLISKYMSWAEKLVQSTCKRRGIPLLEVEGAAGDGLLRAFAKFELGRKIAFTSFASMHVVGAVLDMARRNDSRQCRHGVRPDYQVAATSNVADVPGAAATEALPLETSELVEQMLKAIKTAPGRELLVRCVLCGDSAQEAADRLGMTVAQVDREIATARQQAAAFLVDQGCLSLKQAKEFLKTIPRVALTGRALTRTSLAELVTLAKNALASRPRVDGCGGDRVLSATCSCGTVVRGPNAPYGPIPVKCRNCGKIVDTM
jgi:DNA-directed RNA polymerase specialized sigma24 family protein